MRLALLVTIMLSCSNSWANKVHFTQEDVNLVKQASLAGDSFEFKLEANGDISVLTSSGKGKLLVSGNKVDTVDVPDSDKRSELKDIRQCIKDFLMHDTTSDSKLDDSAECKSVKYRIEFVRNNYGQPFPCNGGRLGKTEQETQYCTESFLARQKTLEGLYKEAKAVGCKV